MARIWMLRIGAAVLALAVAACDSDSGGPVAANQGPPPVKPDPSADPNPLDSDVPPFENSVLREKWRALIKAEEHYNELLRRIADIDTSNDPSEEDIENASQNLNAASKAFEDAWNDTYSREFLDEQRAVAAALDTNGSAGIAKPFDEFDAGSVVPEIVGAPLAGNDAPPSLAAFSGAGYKHDDSNDGTSAGRLTEVVVYNDRSNAADAEYLRFGFWSDTTYAMNLGAVSVESVEIGTFADAVQAEQPDLTDLVVQGAATYRGSAVGMFVRKEQCLQEVTPVSSGVFAAKAELTANFGTDGGLAVEGTVSDFTHAGSPILGGWAVHLTSVPVEDNGHFVGGTTVPRIGSTDETGSPDDLRHVGVWTGQFLGGDRSNAPSAVTGTFNAHFLNGHVAGAFGATKQ